MLGFGDRIYNLRKKSGLSQEEFADRLGVSRQAVSKWETGQSVPDSEKAAAIGAFFGVSLDWLINGVDAAMQEQPQPFTAEQTQVQSETPPPSAPAKKKSGWVKALAIAGLVTLASIGLSALSAFIYMLVVMKAANLADPSTFYMLLIIVPGWAVLFLAVFIISIIVLRKKRKK